VRREFLAFTNAGAAVVEIIYRGSVKDTYETKCPKCRTEFRFTAAEAEPYSDRDGVGFKIACPVCQRMIWKNT
jgi:uncharacterized protein with PIN domain